MFERNKLYITLDIDWASDEVLSYTLDFFISFELKATFFVTHSTPLLDLIRDRKDLFSIGIHPNFLPGSSHGNSVDEVLENVLRVVPESKISRSHSVFQSGRILSKLHEKDIKIDSSIMLPYYKNVIPFKHYVGYDQFIWRVPFIWADDYELCKCIDKFNLEHLYKIRGLKILMFHPIHLFLNSITIEDYNNYKKSNLIIKNDQNGAFHFLEKLSKERKLFDKMHTA